MAVVDRGKRIVTLATAGGEPGMIFRKSGVVSLCDSQGLLIGVERGQEYSEVECPFHPGDTLMLCTDGLCEARSPHGEFLGTNGIRKIMESLPIDAAVLEMSEQLLIAVKHHANGSLHDDTCVLMARYTEI